MVSENQHRNDYYETTHEYSPEINIGSFIMSR